MLKKICILFLLPIFLFAGNVTHQYTFDTPLVKEGKALLQGCHLTGSPGMPCVAQKSVKLLLPKGHEAISYSVHYGEPHYLKGQYQLHNFPMLDQAGKNNDSTSIDNAFYPSSMKSEDFTTQYKNGNAIFIAAIKPVQYNSVTQELRYYRNVSVSVQTRSKRSGKLYKCTPAIKNQIASLVDNPEAVNSLLLTKKGPDDYEYLIITSDALKDSWTDLIDFNKRRCLRTKIQTNDYIQTNINGADSADRVRNYIIQEHTNNNMVYVVLGGDMSPIPARRFYVEYYDHNYGAPDRFCQRYMLADMYYSCLDGDWDSNDNGKYGETGEEDMLWDVYAARFPVDNATDLNNMINKTMRYSENPVADQVTNNLLAGEFLWDSFGATIWGIDHMEQFMGTVDMYGFSTIGFPEAQWSTSRISDKETGASNGWTGADFQNVVNSDKPTWINFFGHGNTSITCRQTSSSITDALYNNNGTNANYFLLIAQSCNSAQFSVATSIMEKFTTIQNGAVACIGFGEMGIGDDDATNSPTNVPIRYLHDAVFRRKIHHIEAMHAAGKEAVASIVTDENAISKAPYYNAMKASVYLTNLFGDPALSIWTASPDSLNPIYDTILTDSSFEMQTPSYTWIALCAPTQSGDSIICTQLTDSGGSCTINDQVLADYVTANPYETLKVRIKAHNYYPYVGNLHIKILGDKPELFDLNGSSTDLPVTLRQDGSDTVDILYQLYDADLTSDTIKAQYRISTSGSWIDLTNVSGDHGLVSGADSSIHRHIRWHARGQLTNSFESDSIQIRVIAIDPKRLSDTLAMALANLMLDFKAPDTVTTLSAQSVSPTEIDLTWDVSASLDADTQLVVCNTSAIVSVSDTVGSSWFQISNAIDSMRISGLTSDTKYNFAVFTRDEVPNWNGGSFTTGVTPNIPPQCQIDSISTEQSDSVSITFSLSDTERHSLTIAGAFSVDGTTWTATTMTGLPATIPDSLYTGGRKLHATWPSSVALATHDIYPLYFRITPSDSSVGIADTISFHLDNYHGQSIVLTTPSGEQNGNVSIPFVVADTSGDSITFACSYSINGGAAWNATQNVDITKVGPGGYSGTCTWSSVADIGENNITTVQFKIVPSDSWQSGTPDTTTNFHVNNQNVPLVVEIIQEPTVQGDNVSLGVRIVAPAYNSVTIGSATFSIDDGAFTEATLTTNTTIPSSSFSNAPITWASKSDFTSNSDNVRLRFVFKAGTHEQTVTSQPFTLNNNSIPNIAINEISGVQSGDIPLTFTISDSDQDTIGIEVQYSQNGTTWNNAAISGDTTGIGPANYQNASILWHSRLDLPDLSQRTVWLKITPYDLNSGNPDTILITINNENNAPTCVIDSITSEQSGSVSVSFILDDRENNDISISCKYSSDGNTWTNATIQGVPTTIDSSLYHGGKKLTLTWLSTFVVPSEYFPNCRFLILPFDADSGVADTVTFPLDNYHQQSIVLTTPTGVQSGNVSIPYVVTDPTNDNASLTCSYSINGGSSWNRTQNVSIKNITPNEYTGSLDWNSTADMGTADINSIRFKIVPSDGWQNGIEGSTQNFRVNNTNIPLVVRIIEQPNVLADTVTLAVRIVAPNYNQVSIDSASFTLSLDNNINITIDSLITGSLIQSTQYDSAIISWASKNDFNSNADNVQLHFVFKADTNIQRVSTASFTLHNNEAPSVTIHEISGVQSGAVAIPYTLLDIDFDTLSIGALFSEDGQTWTAATVTGDMYNIDSAQYDSVTVVWQSHLDLPDLTPKTVFFTIIPFDLDTGKSDTIELIIDNEPAIAGDFNQDKKVNFLDFSYVSDYWTKTANGTATPTNIKELAPATGSVPYLTIIGDTLFDYKDLGVFIQMFYWSLENGGDKDQLYMFQPVHTLARNQSKPYFTIKEQNQKLLVTCNVAKSKDLVSCNFVVQYEPKVLSYNSVDGSQGLLAPSGSKPFSLVMEDEGSVNISLAMLSAKPNTNSNNDRVSNIFFTRSDNITSQMTITYTMINQAHEVVAAGMESITIPESSEETSDPENVLVIIPNPSTISSIYKPFQFKDDLDAMSLLKRNPSGFVFRINLTKEQRNIALKGRIFIYDAIGNIVIKSEGTIQTSKSKNYVDLFWSGHNSRRRKVGSGMYKVVVFLETYDGIVRLQGMIGVKE